MITVKKPGRVPDVLKKRGAEATQRACAAVAAGKTPTFSGEIYGHDEVRAALRTAQHSKCCYCESKITHITEDVEHYRPKGAVRQSPHDARPRSPGYYWLAYEWKNLYLSCSICNSSHKRDLFPLQNPDRRARSPQDRLGAERPVFVDPRNSPDKVVTFRGPTAVSVNGREQGRLMIRWLGLNRSALGERRLTVLNRLRARQGVLVRLRALAQDHPEDERIPALINDIEVELRAATKDAAEYAGMARVLLQAQR